MLATQQARKPRMHQIGCSNRYFGVTDNPVLALISITIPRAISAVTQKKRTILATFIASLRVNKNVKPEPLLKPDTTELQSVGRGYGQPHLLPRCGCMRGRGICWSSRNRRRCSIRCCRGWCARFLSRNLQLLTHLQRACLEIVRGTNGAFLHAIFLGQGPQRVA